MFKKIRQYLALYSLRRMIAEDWEHFAGIAWQGYQMEGRGCVIFGLSEFDAQTETTPLYYVSSDQLQTLKIDNFDEAVEDVQAYDPQKEIVLILALPTQKICLRLNAEDYGMLPPDAFEVHKRSL